MNPNRISHTYLLILFYIILNRIIIIYVHIYIIMSICYIYMIVFVYTYISGKYMKIQII